MTLREFIIKYDTLIDKQLIFTTTSTISNTNSTEFIDILYKNKFGKLFLNEREGGSLVVKYHDLDHDICYLFNYYYSTNKEVIFNYLKSRIDTMNGDDKINEILS